MTKRPGRKGYAGSPPGPRTDFALVESIGRTLPDVEVTTTWGMPTLKVRGRMFVCIASHKSAEPDTLVVMMEVAARDLLVEEEPDVYYLKEHYVNYPCVLVRLSRVHRDALRDLVAGAHRFVSAKRARKSASRGGASAGRGPRKPPG
jgi:hypothetical protein